MRLTLASLALICVSLVSTALADDAARAKFAKFAAQNNGIVKLNSQLHDEILAPGRDWSVIIQYTAMAKEMNCAPCAFVYRFSGAGMCGLELRRLFQDVRSKLQGSCKIVDRRRYQGPKQAFFCHA
jgi:hypothetical protein